MKKLILGIGASVFLGTLVFGPMAAFVQKALATPAKVEEHDALIKKMLEQNTAIGDYVQEQISKEKFDEDQKRKAPKGWRWDVANQEFVRIKK